MYHVLDIGFWCCGHVVRNTTNYTTIHNRAADLSLSWRDDLENLVAKCGGMSLVHRRRVRIPYLFLFTQSRLSNSCVHDGLRERPHPRWKARLGPTRSLHTRAMPLENVSEITIRALKNVYKWELDPLQPQWIGLVCVRLSSSVTPPCPCPPPTSTPWKGDKIAVPLKHIQS
jgi:hypothetical protein